MTNMIPRRATGLAACLAFCMAALPAVAQDQAAFPHKTLARSVLDRHIVPGYRRLDDAARDFSKQLASWCDGRGKADAVDSAFDTLVRAWGRIEHIDFGPIQTRNGRERILFYPDRKGLARRQRDGAMAGAMQSPDAPVPTTIAFDGLPALEDFLYIEGALRSALAADHGPRCRLSRLVAERLAATTTEIFSEWLNQDGYAKQWLAAGTLDSGLPREEDTTRALARSFDSGMERLRDGRIAAPLGFGKTRTMIAPPLQISRRSMLLLMSNCDGLLDLYVDAGLWRAIDQAIPTARVAELKAISGAIGPALADCAKKVESIVRAPQPYMDDAMRRILISQGFPLKQARFQAARLLSEFGGATMGFNASDGD